NCSKERFYSTPEGAPMLSKHAPHDDIDPVSGRTPALARPVAAIRAALNGIDRVLIVVVGVLLVGVLSVVSLQVVMRYVFNAPTVWSEELATLLFVWFVMLGIGPVLKHQEHIMVEVLTELPYAW